MTVRSTEGRETLLKLALPAPQGSGNVAGRLTRRGRPGSWTTSGASEAQGPRLASWFFEALFRPCFRGKLFDHTQAD